MELGLRDRVAVVTGASRGIGKQIALDFAREGAHLVLNARSVDALAATALEAEAHGVRVVQVAADLFDPTAAPLLAERALDGLGRIDVLVNNMGGGGDPTRLHKLTDDDWQQGFELNFFSSVRTTAACLPTMLERGWGRIVHVASTYGVEPGPYFGPYSAAKAALLNYSKNLSHAYSAQGVLSNCVIPGITITEAINDTAAAAAAAQGTTADDVMARMMEKDPVAMGRYGDPARGRRRGRVPRQRRRQLDHRRRPRGRRRHPPQHLTVRPQVASHGRLCAVVATQPSEVREEGGEVAALDLAHGVAGEAVDEEPALGHLVLGQVGQAVLARSSSSVTVAPSRSCTATATRSPSRSSGSPTTAHASTSARSCSTRSISAGYTLPPPRMITRLLRSRTCRKPSSSTKPRSPVCSIPSRSVSAVASSRFQ